MKISLGFFKKEGRKEKGSLFVARPFVEFERETGARHPPGFDVVVVIEEENFVQTIFVFFFSF